MMATFLREQPDEQAAPVSELLPGELFAVLDYARGWAWGYSVADHRVGYVEAIELTRAGEPTHIVCEASAPILADGDVGAPTLCRLPMGTRLHGEERGSCLSTEIGCVPLCYTRRIGESDEDPVAVAERLVGAPYRPGGRSFRGVDCSGLVQLAFALCGIEMPRETEHQSRLGTPVPEGEPLRRGDLVFSGNHVALAVDSMRVVHVSFTARCVKIEPLEAARDGDQPLAVRRLELGLRLGAA
jgi:hypothetical protein